MSTPHSPNPTPTGIVTRAASTPRSGAFTATPHSPNPTSPAAATSWGTPAAASTAKEPTAYDKLIEKYLSQPIAQASAATYAVDPKTGTAQGQIDSILSKDGALMQRARGHANEQSAARGLINSSLAAGNAYGAMIDRAAPIGTADAGFYNDAARTNADRQTQVSMANAEATNAFGRAALQEAGAGQRQDKQFVFDSGENALNRTHTTNERLGSERFTSGENVLNRTHDTNERLGAERFTSGENVLDRAHTTSERVAGQTYNTSERVAGQNYNTSERLGSQQFTTGERVAGQNYNTSERVAGQNYNTSERVAGQNYNTSERVAGQTFTAGENRLNREANTALVTLQSSLNNADVPKTFAANLAGTTTTTVNSILADPNLTPEQKRSAIDNVYTSANGQLVWASTFYGVPIPQMQPPSSTPAAGTPATGGTTPPPPPPPPREQPQVQAPETWQYYDRN